MKSHESLLFTIIEPSGRTYRIYTSGRIEGFEAGATVVNRFPLLQGKAVAFAIGFSPTLEVDDEAVK